MRSITSPRRLFKSSLKCLLVTWIFEKPSVQKLWREKANILMSTCLPRPPMYMALMQWSFALIGRAGASPPSRTSGSNFLYTVVWTSIPQLSTRFFLRVISIFPAWALHICTAQRSSGLGRDGRHSFDNRRLPQHTETRL